MLTLGLAGKPNAGKSTFFTAATMAEVSVADYPFTTIDPNRGVTYTRTTCPCTSRETRCDSEDCRDGKRYVPVELLDVAGLVPGAHEGRGLGNQFLDELTNADAILTVVDASGGTDAEGEPVEIGSYDPEDEVRFVETELDRWLAGIVDRNWEDVERASRSPSFDLEAEIHDLFSGFGATRPTVTAALRELEYDEDPIKWSGVDRQALAAAVRSRSKPIQVVGNKVDIAPPEFVESLVERSAVPATAQGELALRRGAERGVLVYDPGDPGFEIVGEISDAQRGVLEDLRETMGRHGGTGVQTSINTTVYDRLDHVTVYPVQDQTNWTDGHGTMLPDAFLLPAGSTPRDLAFAVHTDIGEGYLHAVDAREGRRIADDRVLEEGDVIKIESTAR